MLNRGWGACLLLSLILTGSGPFASAAWAERVITADTRLTADVVSTDVSAPCIRIAASGVTLDLNGHNVVGYGGKGIGIAIDPGVFDVTIRKGRVTGFETGIQMLGEGATHRLISVTAARNAETGIHAVGINRLEIAECTARENGGIGILLENCRAPYVHHSVAQENGEAGFVVGGGTTDSRVERNVSRYNDGPGIWVAGGTTANAIRRNTAAQNGDFDLRDEDGDCSRNVWSRNLFNTANAECID
jgi:hypothetical protein